uniref:Glycine hydroxymethyltransferase n=1 Tax=Echinostoma caproni TaxID=27848 RepID=A0A183ARV0_9TREM
LYFITGRLPRGTQFVDEMERLSQNRLLNVFKLKQPDEDMRSAAWGVNVQPLSGSPSNFAVFTALLDPGDRIMGLDVTCGGHPSHGYSKLKKKMSAASVYFETKPYQLDMQTELIDYDALEKDAKLFKPKLIIAGTCTHPRLFDYPRLRQICDFVGAILLSDMAHISGLVAAGVVPSPFALSDVVTSTTHKTLRGPRSGMIFFRRYSRENDRFDSLRPLNAQDYETRINDAVFPGLQSGPHENVIAGVAMQPEFKNYSRQVLLNAQALAKGLQSRGVRLVSGGTDLHFVVADLTSSPGRPRLSSGDAVRAQIVADACGLTFMFSLNDIGAALIKRLGYPQPDPRGYVFEPSKVRLILPLVLVLHGSPSIGHLLLLKHSVHDCLFNKTT